VRRHVLVTRSGERVSIAECGHGRSEQPDQGTPTRSRQPLLTGGSRVRAATESGTAYSNYAWLRGANGLGPPPCGDVNLNRANNCAYIEILALW